MLRRAHRRRVEALLALVAVISLGLGAGAVAAVRTIATPAAEPVELTDLGPVRIHLPDDAGPWVLASTEETEAIRDAGRGPLEIDAVWGALGSRGVAVTVLSAAAGTHPGVEALRASVPSQEAAEWAGDRAHAAGAEVIDHVRELVLVVEAEDGDLVILSVCGPTTAFRSGSLVEAFRMAQLG